MLRFATIRDRSYGAGYMGSVACYAHDGTLLAVCPRNHRELEDDDFKPLRMAEIIKMVATGNINQERLDSWVGDPGLWNCWELRVEVPDEKAFRLAIAAAHSAMLTVECLVEKPLTEGDSRLDV